MACCSSTKTEQLESKKGETVKAFSAGGEHLSKLALVPHRQDRSTSQLYGLSTTTCGAGLLTSSCALTFWIWDACSSRRSNKLRNRCAGVRSWSWSQREGRLSDRKRGMCCKCVVDDKIPSLASSLSQG
jgi:hypothetical protein